MLLPLPESLCWVFRSLPWKNMRQRERGPLISQLLQSHCRASHSETWVIRFNYPNFIASPRIPPVKLPFLPTFSEIYCEALHSTKPHPKKNRGQHKAIAMEALKEDLTIAMNEQRPIWYPYFSSPAHLDLLAGFRGDSSLPRPLCHSIPPDLPILLQLFDHHVVNVDCHAEWCLVVLQEVIHGQEGSTALTIIVTTSQSPDVLAVCNRMAH